MALIDFTTLRQVTESYIDANFSTVPVRFENVGTLETVKEFISLRDQTSQSEVGALGETASIVSGLLIIDIFTERTIGTQRSRLIASELATLLSNQTISFINYEVAELRTVGEIERYFQQVLQIPYKYIYGAEETVTC